MFWDDLEGSDGGGGKEGQEGRDIYIYIYIYICKQIDDSLCCTTL